jgi:proline iminopeptidase
MDAGPFSINLQSGNAMLAVKYYPLPGSETVILLHGGPGVPDEMTEVREVLQPFMQVITFDQRGTGSGDHHNCTYRIEDYLLDISTIATFFGLSRFSLLGHSWGGLYAQLYAEAHPEQIARLFLCSPASGCGSAIWKMTEKEVLAYNRARATLPEWLGMGLYSLLGSLGSSRAVRRLFRQVIINYHKGFNVPPPEPEKLQKINARPITQTRREIKAHPPLRPFGQTTYPVIITYGASDAYGKSRDLVKERFPFARYETIPNCGHTPWKHNPEVFLDILTGFFRK